MHCFRHTDTYLPRLKEVMWPWKHLILWHSSYDCTCYHQSRKRIWKVWFHSFRKKKNILTQSARAVQWVGLTEQPGESTHAENLSDIQTHRQREIQTHRHTRTHREPVRHTDTQTHTYTQRTCQTYRHTDRERYKHTDTRVNTHRACQTYRHTDRERYKHTDTHVHTENLSDIQTHRQREIQTHRHTSQHLSLIHIWRCRRRG